MILPPGRSSATWMCHVDRSSRDIWLYEWIGINLHISTLNTLFQVSQMLIGIYCTPFYYFMPLNTCRLAVRRIICSNHPSASVNCCIIINDWCSTVFIITVVVVIVGIGELLHHHSWLLFHRRQHHRRRRHRRHRIIWFPSCTYAHIRICTAPISWVVKLS